MGGWFWEDDSMIIAIFVGTPGGPNHIKHVDYGTCFKNQLVNNGISP